MLIFKRIHAHVSFCTQVRWIGKRRLQLTNVNTFLPPKPNPPFRRHHTPIPLLLSFSCIFFNFGFCSSRKSFQLRLSLSLYFLVNLLLSLGERGETEEAAEDIRGMESTESSYVSSPEAPRKRSPPPPKSPTSGLSVPICFLPLPKSLNLSL